MIKSDFGIFMSIPNEREKVLSQFLKLIYETFGKLEHPIQEFHDIVSEIKIFKIDFEYKDIHNFCEENKITLNNDILKYHNEKKKLKFTLHLSTYMDKYRYRWRPPDIRGAVPDFKGFNSGLILNGPSGSGKSQIMAYIHLWAKENKWVILAIPKASKFTKDYSVLERHITGLYLQHNLVREVLIEFKIMNYQILKAAEVDIYLYGKSDMAGNRDGDPDPIPVVWDKEREVYTDSWKKFIPKVPNVDLANDYPDHHKRLYDIMAKPKNLLEIINCGI